MGEAFLYGNGGSNKVGGTLTVTSPAGVTVTVSKDEKTKTKVANSDGVAVFNGLTTGTWILTIDNGDQTKTQSVEIIADYSTVIAFFESTINVTYPEGSTCTASDGTRTLSAPDTSGVWECVVPNAGTWTFTSTNGADSDSKSVSITSDGQVSSVTLMYSVILFDGSSFYNDLTGGWTAGSNVDIGIGKIAPRAFGFAYSKNKIDLSSFSSIKFTVSGYSSSATESKTGYLSITSSTPSLTASTAAKKGFTSKGTYTLDVSSLSGSYYIMFNCQNCSATVNYCELV